MEKGSQDNNITRLIQGGKSNQGTPPATLEDLQTDFAALRGEINRRDEILRLVLERLPAVQAADKINEERSSRAEAERDEALEKFDQMQGLISALTNKVSDLADPAEAITALTELKYQVEDLRRDTGDRFERLQGDVASLKRRLSALETLERKDAEAERRDIEKVERDVAVLNDGFIADRAMIAEMRLDINNAPLSQNTSELSARVDGVEKEMLSLKDKVVRFLLDQMKQARR